MQSNPYAAPVFAWPTRDELRASLKMVAIFLVFFYAFFGAAAYLADLLDYRFDVGFEFEKRIPFVPAMAAVYLSVGPMMLLSIFILRQPRPMRLLLAVLCAQTFVGFCIFLAFPVETNFPAPQDPASLPLVYRIADLINLKNNQLPSLHLGFAATMAFVYSTGRRPLVAILFHAWALAIAASTVLIHEHNLLDLLAGYLLAWCGARWWRNAVAPAPPPRRFPAGRPLSDEVGR